MIVILSGASGSGKTSTCKLVAEATRAAHIPTGGIYCGAIFQDDRKVGIECSDLGANPPRQPWKLAGIRKDWAGPQPSAAASAPGSPKNPAFDDSDAEMLRYGMWEFSKQALATADQAIIDYVARFSEAKNDDTRPGGNVDLHPPILFVDEIGPLEFERGTGLVKTLEMLDGAAKQREANLRILVAARPDIAARLKERWPDSILVEMTGTSYRETAEAILAAFGRTASRDF